MKVTITAPFGRVQVELPAAAAEQLMLNAVRTAYLAETESDPSSVTAAAVPPSPSGEGLMRAEGPGAEAKDGMRREPDRELIRYLTQENCGGPEGPGEAKRAEPAEADDTPGNESGG